MTTLRTVEELVLSLSNKGYGNTDLTRIVDTVKADRLAISNALVEALEEELVIENKKDPVEGFYLAACATNRTIRKCQNIIRKLLNPTDRKEPTEEEEEIIRNY